MLNKLAKFTHEEFFSQVVKKLILSSETSLDSKKRDLQQTVTAFSNNAEAMKRMCREEKDLQAAQAAKIAEDEVEFSTDAEDRGETSCDEHPVPVMIRSV